MLKKFVIYSYCGEDVPTLEITGPNLRSLELSGILIKCNLINVYSLDDVTLNLSFDVHIDNSDEDFPRLIELLRTLLWEHNENLHYVKELTVGAWCI